MTAKEKAEELVNRMYNVDSHDDYDEISMQYGHAKICALIAVDEILLATGLETKGRFEFYLEVKKKIEQL